MCELREHERRLQSDRCLQQAGLGWRGLHGLLITPRFGPRVRLAAVFTSVENLPFGQEEASEHRWIEEYCSSCRRCAVECPPKAVLDEPVRQDNGLVTYVDTTECFPYFFETYCDRFSFRLEMANF